MFELKQNNELYHHGVKGQKWGVIKNRFSNATMTQNHYIRKASRTAKRAEKWKMRAENTRYKSALNPLYNRRLGKAQSNAETSVKSIELARLCDSLFPIQTAMTQLNTKSLSYGVKYVNNLKKANGAMTKNT